MKIINYKNKRMIPSKNDDQAWWCICQMNSGIPKIKDILKFETIVITLVDSEVLHIVYFCNTAIPWKFQKLLMIDQTIMIFLIKKASTGVYG